MTLPRLRYALLVTSLLAATASAQTAPPIKPGLWEIRTQSDVDGRKAPDMGDRLKNLPPEQRAMIEAKMKERGVSMGGGGAAIKVCLNAESLAQGRWQGGQGDRSEHGQNDRCKSDVTERSGSTWKWHAACTDPEVVSDGAATFTSGESYTVDMTSVMKSDGVPRTTHTTMSAKWLGAGCGDLKPVGSKP